MIAVIFAIFLLFTPALLIYIAQKNPLLDKIGVVTLSFIVGILSAVLLDSVLLHNAIYAHFNSAVIDQMSNIDTIQKNILDISIALALPMLIFSFDIRESIKLAKQLLLPMFLGVVSMFVMVLCCAFVFQNQLDNIWEYASLATGAYIGGGVNMAVIKTAVNVPESVLITMSSYDILLSAFYLLVTLMIPLPLMQRLLPTVNGKVSNNNQQPPPNSQFLNNQHPHKKLSNASSDSAISYNILIQKSALTNNVLALLLSGIVVGLSVALTPLFPASLASTMTIILISGFALLASLIPKVASIATSYRLGMYLVMVFCITIGSMFDVSMLSRLNMSLILFLLLFIWGGFALHLLLCKLCKQDADSFMVTNVACVMSLPFIPLICSRLNNRALLVAGLAVSIIGYIVSSFLGIAVAYILQAVL